MIRRRELRSPLSVTRARALAYRVPWRIDRSAAPLYSLVNASGDVLRGVTVSVSGRSRVRVSAPASVHPGQAVRATLSGADAARDTVLLVRWFPPDGREYLWQVSF